MGDRPGAEQPSGATAQPSGQPGPAPWWSRRDGGRRAREAAALFVLIGAEPHTRWIRGAVELDSDGFILTGAELGNTPQRRPLWEGMERGPYLMETSLPGVFAVGDVRSGSGQACCISSR